MAVNVLTEIHINRSPEDVSNYSSNPDNAREWYKNIRSVNWITDEPLALGSKIALRAEFLGKTLAYTYEVTALALPELMIMRTAQGPFPMETQYTWHLNSNGTTHMSLSNRGEPKGFSKWLAPVMAIAIRRANRNDLRRLKNILEQ